MDTARTYRERVDAWIDALADETDRAAADAAFQGYLHACARFHRYSTLNVLLILDQCPHATRVGGRTTLWERLGYRLKDGAWRSPIIIVRPVTKTVVDPVSGDERTVIVGFAPCRVYDLSQVMPGPHAQPLTPPWTTQGGDWTALVDVLRRGLRRRGIVVREALLPEGTNGYSTGRGVIVIQRGLNSGEFAATLLHEIVHETCHTGPLRATCTRTELECQAESIAYVAATAVGLPMPNTPTYLALYGIGREALRRNIEAIHTGARLVLSMIERGTTHGTDEQTDADRLSGGGRHDEISA